MTETARLVIAVDASGVKTATDDIKKLGDAAGPTEKRAAALGKAIGTVVVAAATGAFASFIKESIDLADNASKAAQIAGVTTEALTGLQYAAGLADVSAGELNNSLKFLNLSISKAAAGSKDAQRAFGDIGVSIRTASGELRSADAVLLDVADRFSQYENGAEKAALAQELFGRSGTALIPLLNAGAAGISELTAQAERFGLVVSQETATASEQFNDSLTTMQGVTRGVGNQLARELLPTLNDVTGSLIDVAENTEAVSLASDVLSGTLKSLVTAGIVVGATFTTVGESIGAFAAGAAAAASGEFDQAVDIFKTGATDYKDTTEAAIKRIDDLWNGTAGKTGAEAAKVAGSLRELKRGATEAGEETAKTTEKTAKLTDTLGAQISSLQFQAETAGKDKDEITLLKLALDGATESQLSAAQAALGTVSAYEKQAKAAEDAAKQAGQSKTFADALNEQIIARRNAIKVEIQSIGIGEKQAEMLRELSELEFEYAERIRALAGAQGTATELTTDEYNKRLELLKKAKQAEIDLIVDGEKQKADAAKSAGAGAKKAVSDYMAEAGDIAKQTEEIVGGALQGLEDQLFSLVKNGKADFKSLATSIADDITRMGIKQLVSGGFGALTGLGAGTGGAGGAGAGLFASFAGMFDKGGNIPAGKFGVVGERGPELVRGPANVTSRTDTAKMTGGNTIIINQPGVSSTREAERSAGATRRAVMGAVNSGSRYA
jgi:lambda family phage tail tape measure protein